MSEKIGFSDKCSWCHKSKNGGEIRTVTIESITEKEKSYEGYVCSEECENHLRNTIKKYEPLKKTFIIGVIAGLSLCIIAGILGPIFDKKQFIYLVALGMVIFGLTGAFIPIVTPQTVQLMGVRKGYALGRYMSIFCIILGIGFGVFYYFST